MVNDRRFPPPWRADKIPGGYVVRDANGQALVYVYSRDNDAEALQARVLTKDGARRIAINEARLPQLLGEARMIWPMPVSGGREVGMSAKPRRPDALDRTCASAAVGLWPRIRATLPTPS